MKISTTYCTFLGTIARSIWNKKYTLHTVCMYVCMYYVCVCVRACVRVCVWSCWKFGRSTESRASSPKLSLWFLNDCMWCRSRLIATEHWAVGFINFSNFYGIHEYAKIRLKKTTRPYICEVRTWRKYTVHLKVFLVNVNYKDKKTCKGWVTFSVANYFCYWNVSFLRCI